MKRIGIVLFALVFLGLPFSAPGIGAPARTRTPPADRGRFVHDEVLVAFRPGANPAVFARAFGGRVQAELEGLGVHLLKVPSGAVESVVAALSRNPQVEFAEPNIYLHLFLDPNDPYDNTDCYWTSANQCVTQWAWAKVNAYAAWDVMAGNAAVRVAVVDTGIDVGDLNYSTPDYTGHADIVGCQTPIIKSFVSGESGNDDHGHGTHVAGTVGACTNNSIGVAGANSAVQLMGVKVLDWSGSGTLSGVSQGIRWAADNGARVINLSLGTGSPAKTLERAIRHAWNKGAVLICAAGNSGTTQLTYPAAYTNCIAVAATDESDAKASFSSYGASWVDVAAPGVNILSTIQDDWFWCFLCYWYGYLPEYDALSGTSMSAPHVAGLAALIWAKGVCTTNTCVRQQIEQTADPIPGTGSFWKFGRVNYYNALK
ncbi:MAG: S8 family peptidase [bacterium]